MRLRSVFFMLSALGLSSVSLAAKKKCEVRYVRTACEGKEKISYKKCGGKKECTKTKRAKNEAACAKAAEKSCRNSRLEITKSKVITAFWDGKPLKTADGKENFCAADRKDFNKCNKK